LGEKKPLAESKP